MAAASAVIASVLILSTANQTSFGFQGQVSPIRHVIIIMQENHSFDNYFGTYPTANGTLVNNVTSRLAPVNGIPAGVCLAYVTGCVSPHLTTARYPENPQEGQSAYEADYPPGPGFAVSSGPQAMVYFDYHSIPAYWDYAEEYGLADNYYAAVLSTTTPNRLMFLTGDTPVSYNHGPPPYVGFNGTIFGQLTQAGVSWGYYDFVGPGANTESTYPLSYISGMASFRNNTMDVSTLFQELASNSGLPDVSFVSFLGGSGVDEHPPSSPSAGEHQTVAAVNAIMESKYWNSTAVFLTYDEGGGFYDHVTPPREYSVDHNFTRPLLGLGQRVPLLVISPYSRLNHVSHVQMSHLSLLHFIEYNWGIPPLNARVGAASLPTDLFNFSQSPRVPLILGTGQTDHVAYPIPLQSASGATGGGNSQAPLLPLALGVIAVAAIIALFAWSFLARQNRRNRGRPD
jgi:phospholipase C